MNVSRTYSSNKIVEFPNCHLHFFIFILCPPLEIVKEASIQVHKCYMHCNETNVLLIFFKAISAPIWQVNCCPLPHAILWWRFSLAATDSQSGGAGDYFLVSNAGFIRKECHCYFRCFFKVAVLLSISSHFWECAHAKNLFWKWWQRNLTCKVHTMHDFRYFNHGPLGFFFKKFFGIDINNLAFWKGR